MEKVNKLMINIAFSGILSYLHITMGSMIGMTDILSLNENSKYFGNKKTCFSIIVVFGHKSSAICFMINYFCLKCSLLLLKIHFYYLSTHFLIDWYFLNSKLPPSFLYSKKWWVCLLMTVSNNKRNLI